MNSNADSTQEPPPGVYIEEDWLKELGPKLSYFFGLLNAMYKKDGSISMSDKAFAAKMNCSERQIKRYLKELEDFGWIYRNTYNTCKGRKRHIVVKSSPTKVKNLEEK